ncbi:MAG: hypothetical protein JNM51_14880 [Bacteroidia bacterium]|nr:hypothetical protein [Bacteroidia bacterium]
MTKLFLIISILLHISLYGQSDSLGIVFNKYKATINYTCSQMSKVDTLVKILNNNPSWTIEIAIEGNEILVNFKDMNKLKAERLKIMRDLLGQKGIDQQRLVIWNGDKTKIVTDKNAEKLKTQKKLANTNECEYMKLKCHTFWRLISKDFIDPNKK